MISTAVYYYFFIPRTKLTPGCFKNWRRKLTGI